ncbi:hypothetical protein TNCV_3105821 [Trichonephila clavipes]|nr:hypothetical protein TNCV_3105821 [Trichonephila clavipes]
MLVGLLLRSCFLIGGHGRRQWAGRTGDFGGLRKKSSPNSCQQTRSSSAIGRQESVAKNHTITVGLKELFKIQSEQSLVRLRRNVNGINRNGIEVGWGENYDRSLDVLEWGSG